MIFGNAILTASIASTSLVSVMLKSSYESAPTNDANVYYRINGGSWILAGQVASTSCDALLTINSITTGSTIELVCEEDITNLGISYNADNSSSCPSPATTYCGDRSTGSYYSLMIDSNEDISITVSVTSTLFNFCA